MTQEKMAVQTERLHPLDGNQNGSFHSDRHDRHRLPNRILSNPLRDGNKQCNPR